VGEKTRGGAETRGGAGRRGGVARKRGGQAGNKNALVHGQYSERLSESDLALIAELSKVDPTDMSAEIAAMRFVLYRAVASLGKRRKMEEILEHATVVSEAGVRLARVLRVQRILIGESAEALAGAFAGALREIGEELGVGDG